VTYISLYLAMLASGSFNWLVARREIKHPITFEDIRRASPRHLGFHLAAAEFYKAH
jgi:hypothetical protein